MKRAFMYLLVSVVLLLTACGTGDNGVNESNDVDGENGVNEDLEANEGNAVGEFQGELPQFNEEVAENEREAIIHTNMGDIHLKFFPEYAPKAVENFLTLSEEGYYDGVIFHRIMENFMIQSGDPEGTGSGGESIYGAPFEDEFTPNLAHFRGALSMANPGRPDTNSSQFFIVQADNEGFSEEYIAAIEAQYNLDFPEETVEKYFEVGGTPHLDFSHTVFGHVIDGMDVVDAIAQVQTDGNNRPVEEVIIERIDVIK
ncbi:peptidylprolyl isomerase [Evansella sp. AB-P1]|nr:peptidylprolyl isomerase [Evansella sp. AB-P1]MDG5789936.1 peptidylprolyl isomerase [Evansella sp. AB-P1]